MTLPSGIIYGPVLGPITITLSAGQTISSLRTQGVPSRAPAGIYSFNGYAVVATDTVVDSFPFEKLGNNGSDWVSNWNNSGEDFTQIAETAALTEFSLLSNSPNPFNPTTTISFTLSVAEKVNLSIYDISGQLVATLANSWRETGRHEVTWQAEGVPSGMYIVRMEAGDFSAVRKLVFLK